MNIQSLSVCVPAKRCINDCKFCCSKMHTSDYADHFTDVCYYASYTEDMRKRLEYGADRYDYHGFSVVVDEDSMSQEENKSAVKYLILRPNGHLYSKWDSQARLIF